MCNFAHIYYDKDNIKIVFMSRSVILSNIGLLKSYSALVRLIHLRYSRGC